MDELGFTAYLELAIQAFDRDGPREHSTEAIAVASNIRAALPMIREHNARRAVRRRAEKKHLSEHLTGRRPRRPRRPRKKAAKK